MTPRLRTYLELERLMLVLDEERHPAAEALRDAMDPIWYSLSDEERRILDERTIGRIKSFEEIRVPADTRVFGLPLAPAGPRLLPGEPVVGWVA
jgi:hypothetical protein